LDPNDFTPSGTFVEFSWHSFDEDGDVDYAGDAMERSESARLFFDTLSAGRATEPEPAQQNAP
jgi:hypothetical protein